MTDPVIATAPIKETIGTTDNALQKVAKNMLNGVKALFSGDGATNNQLIGAVATVGVATFLAGNTITTSRILSGKRAVKVGPVVLFHK
jgi:hypothetical protein